MPEGIKAIDTWVNLNPPKGWMSAPTRGLLRDQNSLDQSGSHVGYLFTDVTERTSEGATPDEMVAAMDKAGIEKAILRFTTANPEPGIRAIQEHPDRFVGGLSLNPHLGMEEVRNLERLVKQYPFIKTAKVSAHTIQKPYNDKIYYPIYAKCIELDIPITANVGIPGPRVPGLGQDPMALDEVCWFFPELKVVMTHGGEPWQALCVKLMVKWPNLYYMTSAFAPHHYPQEIIYYMNTRGADKIMFATGYPLFDFDRCMNEVRDLPLRDNVWSKFLRENAMKVFKLEE
ncbi:MAG: amidohydrolase [Chloroflexi bacterium]|nr:amidohydrolase [Chloroflexota bacterium]